MSAIPLQPPRRCSGPPVKPLIVDTRISGSLLASEAICLKALLTMAIFDRSLADIVMNWLLHPAKALIAAVPFSRGPSLPPRKKDNKADTP